MGSEVEKPKAVRLLPQLRVASPCGERWSAMTPGVDARTRHCGACRCDVHDISAMTAEAAEAFLQKKVGTAICVRLYQRADGTILTREDCSVGASRTRRRRVAVAIAVAGTAALTAAFAPAAPQECTTRGWTTTIDKAAPALVIPPTPDPGPQRQTGQHLMGAPPALRRP